MFSQYEREELAKIEQWFESTDPDFAKAMREGSARRAGRWRLVLRWVLVIVAVLVIFLGLFARNPGLVLSGLCVLGAGVFLHLVRQEDP